MQLNAGNAELFRELQGICKNAATSADLIWISLTQFTCEHRWTEQARVRKGIGDAGYSEHKQVQIICFELLHISPFIFMHISRLLWMGHLYLLSYLLNFDFTKLNQMQFDKTKTLESLYS